MPCASCSKRGISPFILGVFQGLPSHGGRIQVGDRSPRRYRAGCLRKYPIPTNLRCTYRLPNPHCSPAAPAGRTSQYRTTATVPRRQSSPTTAPTHALQPGQPQQNRPTSLIRGIRGQTSGGNQSNEASSSDPNSSPLTGPTGMLMQPWNPGLIKYRSSLHDPPGRHEITGGSPYLRQPSPTCRHGHQILSLIGTGGHWRLLDRW